MKCKYILHTDTKLSWFWYEIITLGTSVWNNSYITIQIWMIWFRWPLLDTKGHPPNVNVNVYFKSHFRIREKCAFPLKLIQITIIFVKNRTYYSIYGINHVSFLSLALNLSDRLQPQTLYSPRSRDLFYRSVANQLGPSEDLCSTFGYQKYNIKIL